MNILVIDAQGGGIGKQLVAAIKQNITNAIITAVGTNSTATSAMLKAGADYGATGENAVVLPAAKQISSSDRLGLLSPMLSFRRDYAADSDGGRAKHG